ncbi:hypothetical protein ACIOEX_02435 [Streptomyces sp. NPDC087850]|uniref:hypothetical protein n=1 Tax=Streptomyces sp. NPDC087850 TaxID=3365809 RepID=UPI00382C1B5D
MTTPDTETPARRRRHARLIVTAVQLTAECALAAAHGVYQPIADAAPTTGDVPVYPGHLHLLASQAASRLDAASAEDKADGTTEQTGSRRLRSARRSSPGSSPTPAPGGWTVTCRRSP